MKNLISAIKRKKEVSFNTVLEENEAMKRIGELVKTPSLLNYYFSSGLLGKITNSNCLIYKNTPILGVSFRPVFRGKYVINDEGKKTISGDFSLHPGAKVFAYGVLGFLALYVCWSIPVAVSIILEKNSGIIESVAILIGSIAFALVSVLLFLGLAVLVYKFCQKLGINDVDIISNSINGALADNESNNAN